MRRIWKYKVDVAVARNNTRPGEFQLTFPEGAEIREVEGTGEREISIWVECNPEMDDQIRDFQIFGTGQPVLSDGIRAREHAYYVGTAFNSESVWHIYEWR